MPGRENMVRTERRSAVMIASPRIACRLVPTDYHHGPRVIELFKLLVLRNAEAVISVIEYRSAQRISPLGMNTPASATLPETRAPARRAR